MNLKLTIYADKVLGPYYLREDGSSDMLPSVPYRFHDGSSIIPTLVEAELEGFDENCEYQLQVGQDPDVIAKVTIQDGRDDAKKGRVAKFQSYKNYKWCKKFQLFQATMGNSRLHLFKIRYDEYSTPKVDREVFCVPVYVVPPDEIKNRYLSMVADLMDAPQFFLDDFHGQMLLNCFSVKWDDGYSSYDDPELELDAIKDVLDKLMQPLKQISQAPKTAFGFYNRMIDVERVRCCRGRVARKMEQLSIEGPNRIMTSVKVVNNNVAAHAVIKEFFNRLMRRCDDIRLHFEAKVKKLKHEILELQQLYKGDLEHESQHTSRHMF